MEPASSIVRKLGGATAVANIVGVHRTRVHAWTKPVEKGGTGGLIPMKHVRKLREHAEREGMGLTANDFLPAPDREVA